MQRFMIVPACVLSVVAVSHPEAFAQPTLFQAVGGQLQATAEASLGSNNAFVPVTYPGPGSNTAFRGPTVWSSAGYDFVELGTQSKIDINLQHYCGYTLGTSRAFTYSDARFTVDSPTPYGISGIITSPLGLQPSQLSVDVTLIPFGGGPYVFRHQTQRIVSGGSSIVIGQAIAGDILTGSAAGTLMPGTQYWIALTIATSNTSFNNGPMNPSGTITVALGVPPCYPNCDESTGSPRLTSNDFQCFLNRFAAGDSYANCDGSSGLPTLTSNDFQCFLNKFAAGCN